MSNFLKVINIFKKILEQKAWLAKYNKIGSLLVRCQFLIGLL